MLLFSTYIKKEQIWENMAYLEIYYFSVLFLCIHIRDVKVPADQQVVGIGDAHPLAAEQPYAAVNCDPELGYVGVLVSACRPCSCGAKVWVKDALHPTLTISI